MATLLTSFSFDMNFDCSETFLPSFLSSNYWELSRHQRSVTARALSLWVRAEENFQLFSSFRLFSWSKKLNECEVCHHSGFVWFFSPEMSHFFRPTRHCIIIWAPSREICCALNSLLLALGVNWGENVTGFCYFPLSFIIDWGVKTFSLSLGDEVWIVRKYRSN